MKDKKLQFAKVFMDALRPVMYSSGKKGKALGLTSAEILDVWKKVLTTTIEGGGQYKGE